MRRCENSRGGEKETAQHFLSWPRFFFSPNSFQKFFLINISQELNISRNTFLPPLMSEWNSCGILRHSPQSVRNLIILDCIPTRSQSMGATEDRLLPLVICFEELTASSKILKEGIPQNSLRIPGGAKKVSAQHFLFLVGVVRTSTPDANYFSLSVFSLFKNTFTFLSMVDGTVYDTIYHLQK